MVHVGSSRRQDAACLHHKTQATEAPPEQCSVWRLPGRQLRGSSSSDRRRWSQKHCWLQAVTGTRSQKYCVTKCCWLQAGTARCQQAWLCLPAANKRLWPATLTVWPAPHRLGLHNTVLLAERTKNNVHELNRWSHASQCAVSHKLSQVTLPVDRGLAWHLLNALLRQIEGLQVTHQSRSRLSCRSAEYPRHCRSCRSPCTAAQRGQAGLRQCLERGKRYLLSFQTACGCRSTTLQVDSSTACPSSEDSARLQKQKPFTRLAG